MCVFAYMCILSTLLSNSHFIRRMLPFLLRNSIGYCLVRILSDFSIYILFVFVLFISLMNDIMDWFEMIHRILCPMRNLTQSYTHAHTHTYINTDIWVGFFSFLFSFFWNVAAKEFLVQCFICSTNQNKCPFFIQKSLFWLEVFHLHTIYIRCSIAYMERRIRRTGYVGGRRALRTI